MGLGNLQDPPRHVVVQQGTPGDITTLWVKPLHVVIDEDAAFSEVSLLDFHSGFQPQAGGGGLITDTPQTTAIRKHPVFHFEDDFGPITLTLQLDGPATRALDVVYILGGDAVEGVHYIVTAGASPVSFAIGEESQDITITPINPASWFSEKFITVEIDFNATEAFVNAELNKNWVFLRATTDPPELEFTLTSSTTVPKAGQTFGLHSVNVRKVALTNDTLENAAAWLVVTGTAVEGVEWEWIPSPAAPYGLYTLDPTSTNRNLQIRLLPGTVVGHTIIMTLFNELSDRSEENEWRRSETWALELFRDLTHPQLGLTSDPAPGVPANHTTGPASGSPPLQLTILPEPGFVTPWNEPTEQMQYSVDAGTIPPTECVTLATGEISCGAPQPGPAYNRKSAEGQVHCAAGDRLFMPVPEFSRFSVYYSVPTGGTEDSRFTEIGCRDRGFQVAPPQTNHGNQQNYKVVYDRKSQSPNAILGPGNDRWAIWSVENDTDGTDILVPGLRQEPIRDSLGVVRQYMRLWFTLQVTDLARIDVNFMNWLVHAVWWSGQDGSVGSGWVPVSATSNSQDATSSGGVAFHRGRAGVMWWPMLETSATTPFVGTPPAYHRATRNFWAPQGNATRAPAGQNSHTVTIG